MLVSLSPLEHPTPRQYDTARSRGKVYILLDAQQIIGLGLEDLES